MATSGRVQSVHHHGHLCYILVIRMCVAEVPEAAESNSLHQCPVV